MLRMRDVSLVLLILIFFSNLFLNILAAEPLDPDSNIPIIVGGVIGGLLIVALAGYGIHHYMNRKNTAALG